MKKKIIFGSIAVIAFVVVASVLFQMKKKGTQVAPVETNRVFSQAEIQEAMNKKADLNVKPVFSQEQIQEAMNKKADSNVKPSFSQSEIEATMNARR